LAYHAEWSDFTQKQEKLTPCGECRKVDNAMDRKEALSNQPKPTAKAKPFHRKAIAWSRRKGRKESPA
jgi:hypothetical protein